MEEAEDTEEEASSSEIHGDSWECALLWDECCDLSLPFPPSGKTLQLEAPVAGVRNVAGSSRIHAPPPRHTRPRLAAWPRQG